MRAICEPCSVAINPICFHKDLETQQLSHTLQLVVLR
ncbi:Uncharacterised protein [Vibrio cholerae]|nr:Uncharacterised protein [Vibrio cholerae]CSA94037.1 Uncharacterised protein [Vibrio cholerae]CSB17336.1 Uncharacterised protein [Vibrio cholerae]CSB46471.1 Uncharacterised protein [Vibrio cholerae]CSD02631.1 Uncharacterised protein [Vibrio cholerae]